MKKREITNGWIFTAILIDAFICSSCGGLREFQTAGKYEGDGVLLELSSNGEMKINEGRAGYGTGTWIETKEYVVLDFPEDTLSDMSTRSLKSLQSPVEHESSNMILIKKSKNKLLWKEFIVLTKKERSF